MNKGRKFDNCIGKGNICIRFGSTVNGAFISFANNLRTSSFGVIIIKIDSEKRCIGHLLSPKKTVFCYCIVCFLGSHLNWCLSLKVILILLKNGADEICADLLHCGE